MTSPKYSINFVQVGEVMNEGGFMTLELDAEGDTFDELMASAYISFVDKFGNAKGGVKLSRRNGKVHGKSLEVIKAHISETDAKLALAQAKSGRVSAAG